MCNVRPVGSRAERYNHVMRLTNPFPGHNPFIEQRWGDFHTTFITGIKDEIQYKLPDQLRARVEETALVSEQGEQPIQTWPDVRIHEKPAPRHPSDRGGVAVMEPAVAGARASMPAVRQLPPDTRTERHIVIVDKTTGGRVVTAIEVVSPWNKWGRSRGRYTQRQTERLPADVSIVEIDLIRDGADVTLARRTPYEDSEHYHVSVWDAAKPEQVLYWGVTLSTPLPEIVIPLRSRDPELKLALQAVYDRCYEMGRYDDVDFDKPLKPAATPDEQQVIDAARACSARSNRA